MIKNSMRGLVVMAAVVLAVFFAAAPALAADLRNADSVIVASGDVVNDDLYAAGNRVVINGTVNGDLLAAGQTIIVNGVVNGSVISVGGDITINGEVTHSVRAAGGNIDIRGKIGGDLAVAGGEVNISDTAEIGRDVLFGAGTMLIRGPVGGDVKGGGGEVVLGGEVRGNVELGVESFAMSTVVDVDSEAEFSVGRLVIEPTAHIEGNLTYISKNAATIPPGAVIGGQILHKLPKVREPIIPNLGVWGKVIGFLMALCVGIVLVVIAPKRSLAVAASIKRRPLPSLGWGALVLVVTPFAALITFITIIGIPVGLLGLVLYGIAIFVSQLVVGLFIGYLIIGSFTQVESRGVLVGALALGFAVLTLVKLIPYLGFPIWLATVLFGLGAMAVSQKTMKEMAPAEEA